jgi:hypothetical protein
MDTDNSSHFVPLRTFVPPQDNNMPQLEGTDFTFSKADSTGISAPGRPVAKTRIQRLDIFANFAAAFPE